MTNMFDNYDNIASDYIPNNRNVKVKIKNKYIDRIMRGVDAYETFSLAFDAEYVFKSIIIYYKQGINIIMQKQLGDSGVELVDDTVNNNASTLNVHLTSEETLKFAPTDVYKPIFAQIHLITDEGQQLTTSLMLIECLDTIGALDVFTITWTNYDDSVLTTSKVTHNTLPIYSGELPTREDAEHYYYEFSGWTPTIVSATENTTYKAVYDELPKSYTININVNDDTLGSFIVKDNSYTTYSIEEPYGTNVYVDETVNNVLHIGDSITVTAIPNISAESGINYKFTGFTFPEVIEDISEIIVNFEKTAAVALSSFYGG